jgi:hypothetical protein
MGLGGGEGLAERVRGDYYERVKVGSVDEVVARIRGELLIAGLRGGGEEGQNYC